MNRTSSILVTGGAGFVGSHLVERLLADGKSVRVLDDLSTGSLDNLRAVRSHPRLRIELGKVSESQHLDEWLTETESVYHLAAVVGVDLVIQSPLRTIQTNLRETGVMLEAASRHRVPLLLTSTSEVYGKSQKAVFAEDDDLLIGPPHLGRWCYACSKLMDEFLALAYGKEQGLPVVIVRLFNTVGPRQTGRFGMVLPRFIAAARHNQPLRVFGTGQQTRCFCDVGDAIEALVRLQNCPAARNQVFNVGGAEEIGILDLAKRVKDLIGSASTIEQVPYDQAYVPGFEDMQRRKPLTDKLAQTIGFRPATPLQTIIQRLVQAQDSGGPGPGKTLRGPPGPLKP